MQLLRLPRRSKQGRSRPALRRRETNRGRRFKGKCNRAHEMNEPSPYFGKCKIIPLFESPFGLDSLARRNRRDYRAFYRCGKNMGFANEPFPGRLACGRGGFRHGLLGGGAQWRDGANHGRSSAGIASRRPRRPLELMPNCRIGPASRRAMCSPRRLRRSDGRKFATRTAGKPGSCNSKNTLQENSGSPVLSGEG